MSRILGVGIATLDIVNEVDGYPEEDSELRALSQQQRRGGNVTNTLVVLSQLGHQCAWAGVLADDAGAAILRNDLARFDIELGGVTLIAKATTPTSYITLNRRNGSRTIVHYRDLPELSATQFAQITLDAVDWVHFEGRNVEETREMLAHVRRERPTLRCSLEAEKPRSGLETLFAVPDVIMLSRQFARAHGFDSPAACLRWTRERAPQAQLFLGWGSEGAYGLGTEGAIVHCPARVPDVIVDTIGAGDAFNAGIIDALLRERTIVDTLDDATQLAGRKCAQSGFAGLGLRAHN